MRKKELIWREILWQAIEKRQQQFTQKELASKFAFSLSTVFNALKVLRGTGTIEVTSRFFRLINIEKLLTIWGTYRQLEKEVIYKTHVDLPVMKLEAAMPPAAIYTAYSAYRLRFKEAPADYDKVYVYVRDLAEIQKRFPSQRSYKNLIVLPADNFLENYGSIAPLGQIYADLWNLKEWYAHDFLEALKKKIF